jgi:pre-mRNA cleavage complex 2 protein Pcf11
MIAEDYADSEKSAAAIYNCIREPLLSSSVSSDRKLPLVYVVDSILKNVRGSFIPVIEKDAKTWMPIVYGVLNEENRARLKKVWNTWKEFKLFQDESWKEMGKCFLETVGIKMVSGILRSVRVLSRMVTESWLFYNSSACDYSVYAERRKPATSG